MGEPWAIKKELEAALRQIHLRLEALQAAPAEGEEAMVYTNAASHTHSGNSNYQTALSLTGAGQAEIFMLKDPAQSTGTHSLQITVDGVVVLTGLEVGMANFYAGIWNFSTSLLIQHLSSRAAIVKAAYCCV